MYILASTSPHSRCIDHNRTNEMTKLMTFYGSILSSEQSDRLISALVSNIAYLFYTARVLKKKKKVALHSPTFTVHKLKLSNIALLALIIRSDSLRENCNHRLTENCELLSLISSLMWYTWPQAVLKLILYYRPSAYISGTIRISIKIANNYPARAVCVLLTVLYTVRCHSYLFSKIQSCTIK